MKPKREKTLRLFVSATQEGVRGVLPAHKSGSTPRQRPDPHPLARRWRTKAEKELASYLGGRAHSFSTPCDLQDLTPFTHAVLKTACQIPYGEVRSYRWLAQRIGRPKATRAVGNALARNPIPIIIPCHRVVRSDGSLGGYALGLGWKRILLEMERKHGAKSMG